MLGTQTLMSVGFGTVFTYVFVGTAVVAVAYILYKAYANYRRQHKPSEFQDTNHDRQQREEAIATYAQNALGLQYDAEQILTRFRDQQQRFGASLNDLDRVLVDIQNTNSSVDQANHTLQDTVINSITSLLEKMKTEYQQMLTLLTTLSFALEHANHTFSAQEKEINLIVNNLQALEANAQMVVSKWPAISQIQKILSKKTAKITELENNNQAYENSLREAGVTNAQLLKRVSELTELNERQKTLLDSVVPSSTSQNHRQTSPTGFKLFSEQRIESPSSTTPLNYSHLQTGGKR